MYFGFNYDVNDNGVMTIFNNDNMVIAEVSECNGMDTQALNNLADEVLVEKGLIKKNYFTEE